MAPRPTIFPTCSARRWCCWPAASRARCRLRRRAEPDGGYAAADHLYSHGCRRIAFVGGFADSSARAGTPRRSRAFLTERGLDLIEPIHSRCAPLRPGVPRGGDGAAQQITETVDGIVCFSDVVAFGVLDAIADTRPQLGSDVRVIGFDDVHDAGLNRPSLSSVAVPARETGRRAAQTRPGTGSGIDRGRRARGVPDQARSRGRPAAVPVPQLLA